MLNYTHGRFTVFLTEMLVCTSMDRTNMHEDWWANDGGRRLGRYVKLCVSV